MLNATILATVVLCGGLLLYPPLAKAKLWRATITPLASIIGSGFLVLGPILDVTFGLYAPLVMLSLVSVAYAFGGAIRYNIDRIEVGAGRPAAVDRMEPLASLVLAFAYVISVAYYLNLFGSFAVSLTTLNDAYNARLLTTAIFVLILIVGWTKGFAALERMEQVSVGLKLAIIAGLLCGLVVHFGETVQRDALTFNPANTSGWPALTLIFGLIVTVQGFETSRYLGDDYDAQTRIKSMRLAQIISTAIYMLYILLLAYAFTPGTMKLDETSIIDMMQIVAPILPVLLVGAALSAQFSAAVADTSGCGGLIAEVSKNRIPPRLAYVVLVAAGLFLTWTSNIFEIISYASRAFAAYYALQATIAALRAWRCRDMPRLMVFAPLVLLGLAIAVFGQAVE